MQPKAKITAIRLAEKAARQPEYARRIGLDIDYICRTREKRTEKPKRETNQI